MGRYSSGQSHSNNKDADSVASNISDTSCRPETPYINEKHQQIAEARRTIVNLPRDDTRTAQTILLALAAAEKLLLTLRIVVSEA